MVDKSYMLEKPPRPGPAKRYLDQVVVPAAIDVAGAGEVAIQRLSQRSGIRPAVLVGGLAGGAVLLVALALVRPSRRDRRSARACPARPPGRRARRQGLAKKPRTARV